MDRSAPCGCASGFCVCAPIPWLSGAGFACPTCNRDLTRDAFLRRIGKHPEQVVKV